jgi:predicted negative regulator of RcsB-dependent stress response
MLRTRKWAGLTLGALVLIVAFGAMSWWQWQRAQRDQVDAAAVPAVEVFTSPD